MELKKKKPGGSWDLKKYTLCFFNCLETFYSCFCLVCICRYIFHFSFIFVILTLRADVAVLLQNGAKYSALILHNMSYSTNTVLSPTFTAK